MIDTRFIKVNNLGIGHEFSPEFSTSIYLILMVQCYNEEGLKFESWDIMINMQIFCTLFSQQSFNLEPG